MDDIVHYMREPLMIHAGYRRRPDDKGIFTVCGVDGIEDNYHVNCPDCIRTMNEGRDRSLYRPWFGKL